MPLIDRVKRRCDDLSSPGARTRQEENKEMPLEGQDRITYQYANQINQKPMLVKRMHGI